MSSENIEGNCMHCKHFIGFDGVTELWTECNKHGSFEGCRTECDDFEAKVSKRDLQRIIHRQKTIINEQEEALKQLQVRVYCQDKEIQKLLAQIEESNDD